MHTHMHCLQYVIHCKKTIQTSLTLTTDFRHIVHKPLHILENLLWTLYGLQSLKLVLRIAKVTKQVAEIVKIRNEKGQRQCFVLYYKHNKVCLIFLASFNNDLVKVLKII